VSLTRADLETIREASARPTSSRPTQKALAAQWGVSAGTIRRIVRGEEPHMRVHNEEAFWAHVDRSGGPEACWTWTGRTNERGYGRWHYDRKPMNAHRASWLWAGRSLTPGLELDHLCRNRACVNPAHLEQVSHRENVLRGVSLVAVNAAKTHCPRGHPYDEVNTYHTPDGRRICRPCQRIHNRAYQRRKRGAA
jgi:hypothetical protein